MHVSISWWASFVRLLVFIPLTTHWLTCTSPDDDYLRTNVSLCELSFFLIFFFLLFVIVVMLSGPLFIKIIISGALLLLLFVCRSGVEGEEERIRVCSVFTGLWNMSPTIRSQSKRRGLPCELERKEICPLAFTCLLKVTHLLLLIFLLLWRYSDDGGVGGGENVRTMHGQCNGRVTTNTHGGKKKKKTLLMASCVTLSITDDESTQVNKFLFSVGPVQLMFLPLVQSHASEYSKRPTSNEGQGDFFSSSSFLLSSSSPSSSRSSFVCCFRMTMAFFFLPLLLLLLLLCLTDNGPPPHVSKKKKNTNCRHHQNVSNLLEKK